GIHAVHHEVQHDLLQLHTVRLDFGQTWDQVCSNGNASPRGLVAQEHRQLVDHLVHVEPVFGRGFFLEERADTTEHSTGAGAVLDNPLDRLASLFEVGRVCREPFYAGVPVGHDRGKRLIDFMRNRGSELAHAQDLGKVGQFRLRFHELRGSLRNTHLQLVQTVLERDFALLLRRAYPAGHHSADDESSKIGLRRRVNGKGVKRRNKEILHYHGGEEDGEKPWARSAEPGARHH